MIIDDLNKGKDKIFQHLVQSPPMGTLPERLFKDYFLPFFLGERQSDNWVVEWVSVAGTPTSEVSVIDDAGVELFRVPAIISSSHLLMNGHKGDLSAVFAQQERLSGGASSTAGLQFLAGELAQRGDAALRQSAAQAQTHERWHAILTRYGVSVKAPSASYATAINADNDYFE